MMKIFAAGIAALVLLAMTGSPVVAQSSCRQEPTLVDFCRCIVAELGCKNPQSFGLCVAFNRTLHHGDETAYQRVKRLVDNACDLSCDDTIQHLCVDPDRSVYGKCRALANACKLNFDRGNEDQCERKADEFIDACGGMFSTLCEPCTNGLDCAPTDAGLSGAGLGCYPCSCTLSGTAPPEGQPVVFPDDCAGDCPVTASSVCSDSLYFVNCGGFAY